jgi:uncharacterized protein involved in outer membrane biogenesis
MLKKFLIGLAAVVVLFVAAVVIGPRFVNWNSYKGRVVEAVRKATGRQLAIDGDISLSLLPSPTLSVEGVRLANLPGGSVPDMARLKSLDVHVALAPLIGGQIQVTRVTLVDPVVLLEQLPDGRANWQFTPAATSGSAASAAGTGASTAQGRSGLDTQISVDNLTVENGTVIYRAKGTEKRLEGLNATVVAPSLNGPFSAKGEARLLGLPARFDVAIGNIAGDGPIPLQSTIDFAGSAASLHFDGTVNRTAAAVKGRLAAKLSEPALVMKLAGLGTAPAGFAQPFNLSSDIAGSSTAVELSNLNLSLGDSTAAGKISVVPGTPSQVQVNIVFNRLDLDKLLPASSTNAAATDAPPASTADAPAPAPAPGGGFALPGEVVANIDLSANAVAYRKNVISRPHFVARLADGQLQIKQATALLPGDSDINIAGMLAAKDGLPHFAGALKARSGDLRRLIGWFGTSLSQVPPDRLRSLSLTSRVIASPRQAELADLDVKLDASHIQGGVTAAFPDGKTRTKPGFGIGLTIDQLDLDAYLPAKQPAGAAAKETAAAGNTQPAAPLAKPASPLQALAPLAGVDANFDLRAGSIGFNGQPVRGLHLQGTLFAGKLTIGDASVRDIGGGQGSASGSIVDLAGNPRYDLKLDLGAPDAARVFQLAGLRSAAPGKFGALKLNGAVKGGADDVDFNVAFAVSGLGVDGAAKGKAQGLQRGAPQVDSSVKATAKNAGPMFQLLGLSADAASKLGAVNLTGNAASAKDAVDYDLALDLPGVGGKGTLKGRLTGLPATPQTATTLKFDVAQPAPLLALAGFNSPAAGKLGALSVGGRLEGATDTMKVALDLAALGGSATLQGTIAAAKAPIAFDLSIGADHPNFANLMTALVAGYRPAGAEPGALKLRAHLAGDARKFAAKDVAFKAGNSDLAGSATVDLSAARPAVNAGFSSNNLDVAALGAVSGGGKAPAAAPSQGQVQGQAQAQVAAPGVSERWSRQPLDLSALDKGDGVIEYKAAHLLLTGNRIDDLVARLRLNNGTLVIEALNGKAYGGSFAVQDGKLVGRALPNFSGHVTAQNIELSEVARTSLVKGPVSLTTDLAASGASQAELVSSLQGRGRITGKATVLSSAEAAAGSALLGVLGSKLKQVKGITDAIGGGFGPFVGKPNDLAGDFRIDHGVVTTENTTLANPGARALFHGNASLPLWKLAMMADIFKPPAEAKPLMTVDLTGSLDRPNVKVTGAAFKQNLPTGNPLQQLLQGVQPTKPAPSDGSTAPAQPGQPQPAQPANPLAPILQNLLGKPSNSP